ncbi:MAG: S9 family peptidase [Phycisphaerales bacterium]
MKTLRIAALAGGFSMIVGCAALVGCAGSNKPPAAKADAPTAVIPRSLLFGNPQKAQGRISPDGRRIAFTAPVNGVMNVWVGPADDISKAKPVTSDAKRGIRQYFWAYTSQHILYLQDKGGDENWRAYSTDVASNTTTDLTPLDGVAARVQGVSRKFPDEILVALNDANPQFHQIYRVNIRSGQRTLVQANSAYASFVTDEDYAVRLAARFTPDGGLEFLKADSNSAEGFRPWQTVPNEDTLTTQPLGLDATGTTLYMQDSRGRDTSALIAIDLANDKTRLLAEDPRADFDEAMIHPTTNAIQAAAFNYDRTRWVVLDKSVQPDLDYLKKLADGEMRVTSRSLDDSRWTIAYIMDNGPVRTYLYNRPPAGGEGKRSATLLYTNIPALESQPLTNMHPVVIKSRDGLNLVSYLSLPTWADRDANAVPDAALPMVLVVHGGPWARDEWGYNPEHQWLANRGYAVLSVNFRGSTGLGKSFTNAGNREWAGKMHDDLLDAVDWAVQRKIADPKKVAIYGGSYGGYSTLVGLTFTPEVFACGVDIVGPSNLVTLLSTIPPYWAPLVAQFTTRVGDHRTEEGKAFLMSRSPLSRVDQIKKPLLIGQGANDPRVKQAEADQIVAAMQAKNIPVTYLLYPDEGHGFARPENRMSFYAVAEAFLAQHLGGRVEPIGEAFKGSSVQVKTGADQVPGLKAASGG